MTMRPEDIKNRTFANALRGYDKDEVRSFLFKVAESSRELLEQLTATESRLAAATAAAVDENDDDFGGDVPAALAEPVLQAPVASLDAAGQSIVDRYGAIGDRIADLLRNADASAAEILNAAEHDSVELRAAAATDAARVRTEAEEHASHLLAEAQSIRVEADAYRAEVMAELANARLEQEAALQEARTATETEVETFRVDSIEEIALLRSDAQVEVDELRSGANIEIAELRTIAQAEADELRESAIATATAAIAEDEAEAVRLREEAEADRIAARSELEDVRSEVSSLLEQARTQSEFIKQEADEIIRTKVRANFEQAQARIDVLRNTEVASRERIVLAQTELAGALTRLEAEPMPELDPADSTAVIEEAERRHGELGPDSVAGVLDVADDTAFEQSVFEADVATATQEFEGESLADYFGPADHDEEQTTGDILAGSFGDVAASTDVQPEAAASMDAGWPTTEINEVEYETVNTAPDYDSAVVNDSTDENDTVEATGHDALPGSDSLGAASHAESVGEVDAPELGSATQEDALARLVREAMQEAVDSARKHD